MNFREQDPPRFPLWRLCLILWAQALASCHGWLKSEPSGHAQVTPAGPTVTTTGATETPGKVTRTVRTVTIPLSANLSSAALTDAGLTLGATPPSAPLNPGHSDTLPPVTMTTTTETAETARNFAPPAPPTAAELASAHGIEIFYWLAAACVIVALFAFYTGHGKAGGLLLLAAAIAPALATLGHRLAASNLLAIMAGAAAAITFTWYLVNHKFTLSPK